MSLKEKWSKQELQRQINSSYYERVMLADAKLATLSRELLQDEFMKNLNNDNLKMIA
jgi:predicted nuclease of restriction endonuclease-like (RecB) superfamily